MLRSLVSFYSFLTNSIFLNVIFLGISSSLDARKSSENKESRKVVITGRERVVADRSKGTLSRDHKTEVLSLSPNLQPSQRIITYSTICKPRPEVTSHHNPEQSQRSIAQ